MVTNKYWLLTGIVAMSGGPHPWSVSSLEQHFKSADSKPLVSLLNKKDHIIIQFILKVKLQFSLS